MHKIISESSCPHPQIDRNTLNHLLKEYIVDFIKKRELPFVIRESIPIVWFGDIDSYEKSSTRVLTIGLNPSKEEFPKNNPRFDKIDNKTLEETTLPLFNTLNKYFQFNPYIAWFSKYNKLLAAMDCSFGGQFGNSHNTALHIDIYSAIATNPTWGGLSEIEKTILQSSVLFDKLLDLLNPDIILISVNKQVFFDHFRNWEFCIEENFSNNFYIRLYKKGGKRLIWGRNMRGTPFGGIEESVVIETINNLISL